MDNVSIKVIDNNDLGHAISSIKGMIERNSKDKFYLETILTVLTSFAKQNADKENTEINVKQVGKTKVGNAVKQKVTTKVKNTKPQTVKEYTVEYLKKMNPGDVELIPIPQVYDVRSIQKVCSEYALKNWSEHQGVGKSAVFTSTKDKEGFLRVSRFIKENSVNQAELFK